MSDNQRPEVIAGQRVRALRQGEGWSQQELADRMAREGFPWRQTTATKTETAARPLRIDEAVALARVFDVQIGYLLKTRQATEDATIQRLQRLDQVIGTAQREIQQLEESQRHAAERLQRARTERELVKSLLDQLRKREDENGEHQQEA